MKPAFATKEVGLRPAVASINETADATPLASFPGVNRYDLAASKFSLIFQKALKLSKAPRVEASFGFTTRGFNTRPNVGEVLNHDSGSWLNAVEDRGGNNVVAIPSEALFTFSEASKVSLSTLRAVGLQITSEAKGSFDDFFHVPTAVKAVIGSNSRSGNTKVNPDSLAISNKGDIGQIDYNMKVKPPLAEHKVGSGSRKSNCIFGVFGRVERNPYSALSGCKVQDSLIPIQSKGMQVVPGRTEHRLGAPGSQSLFLSGDCGLYRFGCLLPRLNMKVRHQVRQSSLTITVCQAVQRVSIAVTLIPTYTADGIERLGKLFYRLLQRLSLLASRLERYPNRPIHTGIIPYTAKNMQVKRKERGQFLCQLKQAVPLP